MCHSSKVARYTRRASASVFTSGRRVVLIWIPEARWACPAWPINQKKAGPPSLLEEQEHDSSPYPIESSTFALVLDACFNEARSATKSTLPPWCSTSQLKGRLPYCLVLVFLTLFLLLVGVADDLSWFVFRVVRFTPPHQSLVFVFWFLFLRFFLKSLGTHFWLFCDLSISQDFLPRVLAFRGWPFENRFWCYFVDATSLYFYCPLLLFKMLRLIFTVREMWGSCLRDHIFRFDILIKNGWTVLESDNRWVRRFHWPKDTCKSGILQ